MLVVMCKTNGLCVFDLMPEQHNENTYSLLNNITGCSISTRALLPWLAVHEMCDMKMNTASMVSLCKKDNWGNR
jgi:hypothetical protein